VDERAAIGVCDVCKELVHDWDLGKRSLSPAIAAQHQQRIRRCGSCGAAVIWFTTRNGRPMPVNAESVHALDSQLELPRHISHFATCPNAARHRRK
jgi:hypothetical protein